MKTYKTTILLLLFGIIFSNLTSCKKYPDGPTISLRSRKERISNNWKVENYKINGSDFTSIVTNYKETFTKEGNYSYSWDLLNGSGTWKLQNNDEEIKLTGSESQTSRTLFILKLEEDSFWYYSMNGSDKHELHFTSK